MRFGGRDTPRGEEPHDAPPLAGHTCAICGEPITPDVWDMTVWATETTLAYICCIFAGTP